LERCRAEAAELGLGEQATFEGRVPDIREAYAAGHVFVLCSISEGFPYSLIEAMACGRACVGTDVGGVSEALGDDAGLIVPPRSPAALAGACVRLLRDDGLRRTLGAAARARSVEHFTVDRAVSAFDELYQLLGSGSRDLAGSREIAAPGPDATSAPVTAQPRQEADHHQGETVPQSPRWLALPPEEEDTVVGPRPGATRPDAPAQAAADQEITQVMPVLGRSPSADSERTVVLPPDDRERPEPADQDRTVIMPRPVRTVARPEQDQDGSAMADPEAVR
jgi:hypothetical protein